MLVRGSILCFAFVTGLIGIAAAAETIAPRPSAGCSLDRLDAGRRLVGHIEAGGLAREYVLDVPDSIRPHTAAPLLFDFHGFGHSGAGVWAVSRFRDLAPQAGLITVYPEGLPVKLRLRGEDLERPGWEMFGIEGNRDLAFVRALLDDLTPVDNARDARDDWLKVDGCSADTKVSAGATCTRWSACRSGAVGEYC